MRGMKKLSSLKTILLVRDLVRDASHLHRLLIKVIYLLHKKLIFNYFKAFANTVGLRIMLAY